MPGHGPIALRPLSKHLHKGAGRSDREYPRLSRCPSLDTEDASSLPATWGAHIDRERWNGLPDSVDIEGDFLLFDGGDRNRGLRPGPGFLALEQLPMRSAVKSRRMNLFRVVMTWYPENSFGGLSSTPRSSPPKFRQEKARLARAAAHWVRVRTY